MNLNTMSLGRRNSRRQDREAALSQCMSRSIPQELDVVDKGDHLKIVSCGSKDVAAWWMGALRAAYPLDHYSDSGDSLKMHPAMGVTLKLNRNDGTLKIKGKKHMQWFKDNFEQVIESGNKSLGVISEMSRTINRYLRLDDGYTLPELLDHLPVAGAIKHGPSYCYRLWKGLLDQWISTNGTVYVISPLLDSKRLADILLLLVKHKASQSKVKLYTMNRCDGDVKFPKVYKNSKHMLKTLKNPNTGKKLIIDERMQQALNRFSSKYGSFHCKLIACVREEVTELLLTSANFHNWHFHYDHSDMVVYFRLPTDDFREFYLEPLGLSARDSGSMPLLPRDNSTISSTGSGSLNSPSNMSNMSSQAFPSLSTTGSEQNGIGESVSNSETASSGSLTPTSNTPSGTLSNTAVNTPVHVLHTNIQQDQFEQNDQTAHYDTGTLTNRPSSTNSSMYADPYSAPMQEDPVHIYNSLHRHNLPNTQHYEPADYSSYPRIAKNTAPVNTQMIVNASPVQNNSNTQLSEPSPPISNTSIPQNYSSLNRHSASNIDNNPTYMNVNQASVGRPVSLPPDHTVHTSTDHLEQEVVASPPATISPPIGKISIVSPRTITSTKTVTYITTRAPRTPPEAGNAMKSPSPVPPPPPPPLEEREPNPEAVTVVTTTKMVRAVTPPPVRSPSPPRPMVTPPPIRSPSPARPMVTPPPIRSPSPPRPMVTPPPAKEPTPPRPFTTSFPARPPTPPAPIVDEEIIIKPKSESRPILKSELSVKFDETADQKLARASPPPPPEVPPPPLSDEESPVITPMKVTKVKRSPPTSIPIYTSINPATKKPVGKKTTSPTHKSPLRKTTTSPGRKQTSPSHRKSTTPTTPTHNSIGLMLAFNTRPPSQVSPTTTADSPPVPPPAKVTHSYNSSNTTTNNNTTTTSYQTTEYSNHSHHFDTSKFHHIDSCSELSESNV